VLVRTENFIFVLPPCFVEIWFESAAAEGVETSEDKAEFIDWSVVSYMSAFSCGFYRISL
jgi:hypothetical protein